jgi:hypothetical protein
VTGNPGILGINSPYTIANGWTVPAVKVLSNVFDKGSVQRIFAQLVKKNNLSSEKHYPSKEFSVNILLIFIISFAHKEFIYHAPRSFYGLYCSCIRPSWY